jgi:hypothetical protein
VFLGLHCNKKAALSLGGISVTTKTIFVFFVTIPQQEDGTPIRTLDPLMGAAVDSGFREGHRGRTVT